MKFKYLCDLFDRLEQLESADVPQRAHAKNEQYYSRIAHWFNNHRSLISNYDALLSCLLPEQRVDRVYGMQRERFTNALAHCLGLGAARSKRLRDVKEGEDLSLVLESIVSEHSGGCDSIAITIYELDQCLHNLAVINRFSSPKVRSDRSTSTPSHQRDILRPVVARLPAREMKWFVRIFFKKLGPLQLKLNMVLKIAHPLLPMILKVRESFEDALALLNNAELRNHMDDHGYKSVDLPDQLLRDVLRPAVGAKVGRPRFMKARSFKNCADMVGARRWAVEPKYDGEYCQVHVDLSKGNDCLQIFSKSGKDSTKDRQAAHVWIKQVLKIDGDRQFEKQCVLEGEMVVVDVRTNEVLGFDKIRKHVSRSGSFLGTKQDSPPHEHEQLRIIFYDALMVDDKVLIHESYVTRRDWLRKILPRESGLGCRGSWTLLDLSQSGKSTPGEIEHALKYSFKKSSAKRYEGLVLKPADGSYLSLLPHQDSDYNGLAIKMKSDYIPGLGDTADFAVIGAYASSDHDVEPDLMKKIKWTHFVLACLLNKPEMQRHRAQPSFKIMGAVSRPSVSQDDVLFLNQHGQFKELHQPDLGNECTPYEVRPSGVQTRPDVLFKKPFIVDVLGGSFERPPNTNHYMLRHPRIVKIHNDDRGVVDIVSFDELQTLAKQAREIPADMLQEERRVMRDFRKACEPKRLKHIEQRSPVRMSTTTVSPASTTSSRTPHVLIRMDSCEMEPGEPRFVSPLATKTYRDRPTSLGETLANDTLAIAGRVEPTDTALVENQQSRKRKLEPTKDISPPKKRLMERSKSDGHAQTLQRQTREQQRDISSIRSAGEIFHTPRTAPCSAQSESSIDAHMHRSAPVPRKPSLAPQEIPLAERIIPAMPSLWNHLTLPTTLKHATPLSDCVVLLSPQIAGQTLITEQLLPLFQAHRTDDVAHWQRDRRPLAPEMGAVVEESQCQPGLFKILLVDASFGQDNKAVLREVMKVRLGIAESIDVWDWRALEQVARLDSASTAADFSKDMLDAEVQKIEQCFIGTIRMTTRTASEEIRHVGFEQACKEQPDLERAWFSMVAAEFEDGQDLVNIFEKPGDGAAVQAFRSWSKDAEEGI